MTSDFCTGHILLHCNVAYNSILELDKQLNRVFTVTVYINFISSMQDIYSVYCVPCTENHQLQSTIVVSRMTVSITIIAVNFC